MFRITKLLLSMIFIQLMIRELAATNVALNKIVKDCNGKRVSGVVVDGNKDPNNDVVIETQCDGGYSSVVIYFARSIKVHYVVVYAGKNTVSGQLDYFNVIVSHDSTLDKCSEFSGPSIISETGMRVNCNPLKGNQNKVIIQSQSNKGFSICEIEVHTLGSGIPGEGLRIFRGCFKQFGKTMESVWQPVFISCQVKCARDEYIFYGIKDGSTCHCDYTYDEDEEIPKHNCSLICDDGKHFCGGPGVYSVYLTISYLPTYRGCFDYPASPNFQDDMTIGKCLQQCDGFIYALLQDGKTCICEDDIDLTKSEFITKCNSKCSGDSNEFCGGNGFAAVYETCKKKKRISIKCSKIIMCDIYDKYGVCKGPCKSGFLGEHCLERDSSLNDYTKANMETTRVIASKTIQTSVSELKTNQISVSGLQTSQSSVSELQTSQSDACKKLNPCIDEENANCVTHRGKPKCVCIIGYTKDDRTGTCEDIDECKHEPCDNRYSFCINLNGSYICKCKPSYNATKSDDICLKNDHWEAVDQPKFIMDLPTAAFSVLPLLSMLLLGAFLWFSRSSENEMEKRSTPSDLSSTDEDN